MWALIRSRWDIAGWTKIISYFIAPDLLVGGGGMGDGGGGRERDIRYIFSDCFMKTYSVGTH